MSTTLYYVHDPMCSWCWGFEPVRRKLFAELPENISVKRLLGGLAPDSALPMPEDTCLYLQATWRKIQQSIPGTEFNLDFWSLCHPRRSTFPACRAVIAARQQGAIYDEKMTHEIQLAYYTKALNPSNNDTLIALAEQIGLQIVEFSISLTSDRTQQELLSEIRLSRQLQAVSFPSLILKTADVQIQTPIDYLNSNKMLQFILEITKE
jgi:putative protein-disulfide isomerase